MLLICGRGTCPGGQILTILIHESSYAAQEEEKDHWSLTVHRASADKHAGLGDVLLVDVVWFA